MPARVANGQHAANENELVPLLLVFIARGFQRRKWQLGTSFAESSHHQLVTGFCNSRILFYGLIQVLKRLESGFRIVTIIEQVTYLGRQILMDIARFEWMQRRDFCGRLCGRFLPGNRANARAIASNAERLLGIQ